MKKQFTQLMTMVANFRLPVILIGMILPAITFSQITINTSSTTATVNSSSDPVTVTGSGNLNYADVNTWLNDGISVLVQTSGNISVAESITKTSGGDCYLTLKSNGSVTSSDNKTISSSSGALNIIFWADADGGGANSGTIEVQSDITTNGGGIWMGGGGGTDSWVPFTGATTLTVGNGPATGTNNNAISIYGSAQISTGAGNIKIYGNMHNYNTGYYGGSGTKISTTDGYVDITGISDHSFGVSLRTSIITGTGDIVITGSGYTYDHGGVFVDSDIKLLSASGNIIIDGENTYSSIYQYAIKINNTTYMGHDNGTTLSSSTSNITIRGDKIYIGNTLANTSGTLTLEPKNTSFGSTFTWLSNLHLASTISGLTIGKNGNNADILLASSLVIDGPLTLYGSTCTASSTTTCTDLNVTSGTTFTLNSGASLITSGNITNSGTMQISRTMSESVWHMISIPVEGLTANTFLGDYLQSWDETTGVWENISNPLTPLNTKQGYSLWATPAKSDATYTFTGTLLTGNQSTPITYHAVSGKEFDGANLLGNPYPSSIDWDQLQATYGSNYIWDGTAYKAYSAQTGYELGHRYIPPMQGFFILTTNLTGNFNLTNTARTHEGAANFYKSSGSKSFSNGIVLEASNGYYSDQWCLVFNPEASDGFELPWDARKLLSGTPGISQLWSVSPDGNLAIDIRPETSIIQLGFSNDQPGIYTISLKEMADIQGAVLEDTKTSIFHDLAKGAYEFAWDVNDDENRFKLHLNSVGIEETAYSESDILIYTANGQIFIKNVTGVETHGRASQLTVSDIMGRVVLQQNISSEGLIAIPVDVQTGIYLVTVTSGQELKTEKVFIR